jgi:hypothetical protein
MVREMLAEELGEIDRGSLERLFGQVIGDEIRLSKFGEIAHDEWLASAVYNHGV